MIRKATIWVGLTSFIFQALLFNAILLFSWEYAKHESETPLAHGKLIISQQAYKDLRWLNDHEFVLGKYLCDVYKKTSKGDKIAFVFKVDEKEKGIIEKLADHFAKSRAKKDIPSSLFYFDRSQVSIAEHMPCAILKLNTHFLDKVIQTDPQIDSPPPRTLA